MTFYILQKEVSALISQSDSEYIWQSGLNGKMLDHGADKTVLIQAAVDSLTSGGTIFLREVTLPNDVTFGNSILIIEDYQGQRKIYSNQGKFISVPLLDADPDTEGWGEAQKGYTWFNVTDGRYKYWTGAAIIPYPAAGGEGAPADASYVTINPEEDLEAEIQHANITDQAQLHICKFHQLTHRLGGSDELDHNLLTGYDAAKHLVHPNTIANTLNDHTKAAHDALGINAATLDGSTKTEVQSHTPQAHALASHSSRTCSELTDHNKATHDILGINADMVDSCHIERGSGTIGAGNDSVVINHNQETAAIYVSVSPTCDWGGKDWYISNKTSTQFTVNCSDPLHDGLTFDYVIIA